MCFLNALMQTFLIHIVILHVIFSHLLLTKLHIKSGGIWIVINANLALLTIIFKLLSMKMIFPIE